LPGAGPAQLVAVLQSAGTSVKIERFTYFVQRRDFPLSFGYKKTLSQRMAWLLPCCNEHLEGLRVWHSIGANLKPIVNENVTILYLLSKTLTLTRILIAPVRTIANSGKRGRLLKVYMPGQNVN
jgi:hypothetical protein